jgi:hypothetical protein
MNSPKSFTAVPDISGLEWEPRTALNPGLEKTIAYFDRQLRN